MTNYEFPPLNRQSLIAIQAVMVNYLYFGQDYVQQMPYSEDIKEQLKGMLTLMKKSPSGIPSPSQSPNSPTNTEPDPEEPAITEKEEVDLLTELNGIYNKLQNFKSNTEEGLSPSERLNVFKLQTNLLEKLLDLRERAIGIKDWVKFREVILACISVYLDADARKDLMDQVENI